MTRVLFDGDQRAIGVEYLEGERLYRADRDARPDPPARTETVRATREVVLAAGAFNTPQLLKLSGIGARAELEKHDIEVRVDLPGVGENLQDRYEVPVIFDCSHRCQRASNPGFTSIAVTRSRTIRRTARTA